MGGLYSIYDKLAPNDAKQGKDGKIRRKGLRRFFLTYFVIMFVCYYIAKPIYGLMAGGVVWAFIILCVLAFVNYCKDGPVSGTGPGITAETFARAAKSRTEKSFAAEEEEPYEFMAYPVDETDGDEVDEEDDDSATSEKKPQSQEQRSKYNSPLEELVVSEVLYGLPFDPSNHKN